VNYILDTCVVSELTKSRPDPNVVRWISAIPEDRLYLSVLSIGEIQKGIEKLPDSKRKAELILWFETDLMDRFEDRILDFGLSSSLVWGTIQARAEAAGHTLSLIDGLIASIAIDHDMTLVSRNSADFEHSGADILNPWLASTPL